MSLVSFITGLALLSAVSVDFLVTTISASGRRTMSIRLGEVMFRAITALPGGTQKHSAVGLAVLVCVAALWILGFAVAWALILSGVPGQVILTSEREAAGPAGLLAHVGHLLSTVGGGMTRPNSVTVALIGVFVGVNGMVVLTISVGFLTATTQTVSEGRAFILKTQHLDADAFCASRTGIDALCEAVTGVARAPFALFFSHADPRMRLPAYLSRRIGEVSSTRPELTEMLLIALPGVGDAPLSHAKRLSVFARRFSSASDG